MSIAIAIRVLPSSFVLSSRSTLVSATNRLCAEPMASFMERGSLLVWSRDRIAVEVDIGCRRRALRGRDPEIHRPHGVPHGGIGDRGTQDGAGDIVGIERA